MRLRGFVAALIVMQLSLGACSTQQIARFETKVATQQCAKGGLVVGSVAHRQCVAANLAAAEHERANTRAALVNVLGATTQVWSAEQQDRAIALSDNSAIVRANPISAQTNSRFSSDQQAEARAVRLCPDGSYVSGPQCYMAADGTYHGASPQLAPDGTYVSGKPQLAPNGSYVGGSGNVILCPDGTYVTGSACVLTPNGHYVGR